MAVSEMPLAVFTFLMQLAIGAFIAVEAVRIAQKRRSAAVGADAALNKVVYIAFAAALAGLLASFLHLKVPLHAPFALVNFETSWMTREIWFAMIFIVLLFAYCVMLLRKAGCAKARLGLATCAAVIGLALVFCMANAYMNPAHPAWDTPATVLTFYATTFLIGPALVAAVLPLLAARDVKGRDACDAEGLSRAEASYAAAQSDALKVSAACGMVALAVASVATTLSLCNLAASGDFAAVASVSGLVGEFGGLFAVRLVLAFAGVGAAGCALYANLAKAAARPYADAWAIAACVLLLSAEFIGRNLFYASAVQIGL